ncbi:malonyl-coa decarboxylase-like protein [Strigomonas culicis]|uniref:Malonyl-coa decarboxylase-like protein n=1 Tax=Strigomonas culicis TaxID=28005 RepID=S9VP49_9TRYP|nr:malonyl-coa decarboxylase-like protein [Strigomonas culicis]|eukprot:EPY28811.1 malonyl-coa decarboxylase-like protein [Strigomonas culicis]
MYRSFRPFEAKVHSLLHAHQARRPALSFFCPSLLLQPRLLSSDRTAVDAATGLSLPDDKKRVLIENRTSTWCRRIWELSKHVQALERQRVHGAAPRPAAAADPSSSEATPPSHSATTAAEAEAQRRRMLSELQLVLEEERKGEALPAAVVDAIWAVYDSLFPPRVQDAVNNRHLSDASPAAAARGGLPEALTSAYVNHFFSFVRVLTQRDFNVDGVDALSTQLSAAVEQYKQTQGAAPGAGAASQEDDHRRALKLKNKIMGLCFDLRTAGSPLHYLWLRHSASQEGGTRRLMEFRKTIHYFDIECKKQLERLRKPSAAGVADGATAEELRFWTDRKNDIATVDASLSVLFHDFFAKEYLVMEELRWYATAPSLLEHVMAAEHVHPFVNGFADFKRRMQPTHHRHCFAFLHPSVVEEPLIAVQVALTRELMPSVDVLLQRPTPLLDPANTSAAARAFRHTYAREIAAGAGVGALRVDLDPPENEAVDTAIFYSINSAQSSLRGMDMGNLLIKRVVQEVQQNINLTRTARGLPAIVRYSTLSPIPGYTRWLSAQVERLNTRAARLEAGPTAAPDSRALDAAPFGTAPAADAAARQAFERAEAALDTQLRAAVLAYGRRHFAALTEDDQRSVERLEQLEARQQQQQQQAEGGDAALAARLRAQTWKFFLRLLLAPDPTAPWYFDGAFATAVEAPLMASVANYLLREKRRGRVLDPVGNFHIANGAMVRQLNFLGNASVQGEPGERHCHGELSLRGGADRHAGVRLRAAARHGGCGAGGAAPPAAGVGS